MNEQLRQQALESFRKEYGGEDAYGNITVFPYYLVAWEKATEAAKRELDELKVQLNAWHLVFETTQLSHARAKLESLKAENERLKRELLSRPMPVPEQLDGSVFVVDRASNVTAPVCNCGYHRHGELTGGWQCPVHGQQW